MVFRAEIDVQPLREAFKASGLSIREVARRMERDEAQVRRTLKTGQSKRIRKGRPYGPYPCRSVTYETAVLLAQAMEVDPWELGL